MTSVAIDITEHQIKQKVPLENAICCIVQKMDFIVYNLIYKIVNHHEMKLKCAIYSPSTKQEVNEGIHP